MMLYFGFGANRDIEMIRAITGKGAIGVPATLLDFQLCTESLNNIPVRARNILKKVWDEEFVSYAIVRKKGGRVAGRLWLLTNRQRELVKQWELCGLWSHDTRVTTLVSFFGIPLRIPASSEECTHQKVSPVSTPDYPTFVVSKEKLLQTAKDDYLQSLDGLS